MSRVGRTPGIDRHKITHVRIGDLVPNANNARTHSPRQIAQIARSIERFGFNNPVLVDGNNQILAGHGRVAAARILGLTSIPVLKIEHLTDTEKRAYVLADNKLAEKAGWDAEILALELQDLVDLDFEVELTGFETGEIDLLLDGKDADGNDADDACPDCDQTRTVVQPGDRWRLGDHVLVCGDARDNNAYQRLLGGERAAYAITDPPYNVKIDGHASGLGRVRHREFAMGSGELSQAEFAALLGQVFQKIRSHTVDGAIAAIFMDWRHMAEILAAGREAFAELKNVCVWVKPNGGMGSFYRSRHELSFIWKCSPGKHLNNFELGQHGRSRTNVWEYAGVNSFKRGRLQELQSHPTVKPVAMIADAIRDCSRRGDLILDPFCGSGTILIAAERSGRRARAIEIDPHYCDVSIRRWQERTGKFAVHIESGASFEERQAATELTKLQTHPVHKAKRQSRK
jgi:DNA modification methylase